MEEKEKDNFIKNPGCDGIASLEHQIYPGHSDQNNIGEEG